MDASTFHKYVSMVTAVPQKLGFILRWRAFDRDTSEGRSHERHRRLALTALAFGGAKGASILTMVVSVPLTLAYLGPERYGLWMTISSFIMLLSFADLGMGVGLMQAVAEADGRNDWQAAASYVSSGCCVLTAMAGLVLAALVISYSFIPWNILFNVTSVTAAREAGPAMAVFVCCFAVNLPVGIVQWVQRGYQEGFISSLWEAGGKVLALIGLLGLIYWRAGLPWLVLAMAGAPLIVWLINGFTWLGCQHPWLIPRWHHLNLKAVKKIFRISILLFGLKVMTTLNYAADNIIVSHVLGLDLVAQYSIPYQMFGVGLVIMNMVVGNLWPAYGEAIARGDVAWVKHTFTRSIWFSLLCVGVPMLILAFLGKSILHLWVGSKIAPSFPLLLGMGVWVTILSVGNAMSVILNAANVLRYQILFSAIMLITSLTAKVLLTHAFGLPGVIWGANLAYSLCFVLPCGLYLAKIFPRMQQI